MSATSVFIAESVDADDFYDRRMDGFAANEVLKIQGCPSEYRIVLNAAMLRRAINEAAEENFAIFHLSCHGSRDGIYLADETFIDWLRLAKMLRPLADPERTLVMASCSGGHYDLTKALTKADAIFGYVFGSTDREGVGFTDSALGWSVLYRAVIQDGLKRSVLRRTVDIINHVSPGDFVLRRWDGSVYRRYPII